MLQLQVLDARPPIQVLLCYPSQVTMQGCHNHVNCCGNRVTTLSIYMHAFICRSLWICTQSRIPR